MIVKYYNNKELSYTNRKRYRNFSFEPFYTEEQKSILLGDGARTTIKTKKSNICNYVAIDNTRWYVTSYIYLNGGQVLLNLQRDVIGEFGVDGCFGKIERGFTESFLRNRKELGLNQRLKERKKLIPENNLYGNYSVNNHKDEMWGILYLTKPTEINPNTGEYYPDQVNINIPAFNPKTVDYDFIESGTSVYLDCMSCSYVEFRTIFADDPDKNIYVITINFNYNASTRKHMPSVSVNVREHTSFYDTDIYVDGTGIPIILNSTICRSLATSLGVKIGEIIINKASGSTCFNFPTIPTITSNFLDYDGVVIKKEEKYYSFSTKSRSDVLYGHYNGDENAFYEQFIYAVYGLDVSSAYGTVKFYPRKNQELSYLPSIVCDSQSLVSYKLIENVCLSNEEAGTLVLDVSQQLIDEPYIVVVVPLFDVKINNSSGEIYNITKKEAFMVFNTVIQYLSGSNGYLVDAQIYPYCPVLTSCSAKVSNIPFFSINSTCYEHNCGVNLLPFSDIKKEYIQRSYSIVSPEQTGKFTFNFYDYTNKIEKAGEINYAKLNIRIKTALKPFSIISSAVIQPDIDSLVGQTYESDLRGSQSAGNGFQCSLSSNAFETYKRQNSNYQQIFNLQKDELRVQHDVERVNDITATVVNTLSATAMGALAGQAMADYEIMGFRAGGAGASVGAGVAGGVVGGAMALQTLTNETLRSYEKTLQQQRFDLEIGTIKNLPNSINRISSFNEIIMKDFCYCVEIYECSELEKTIVDNFISNYGYGIGVFDYLINYQKDGWFLRSTLVKSNFSVNLHSIAETELMGGIYLYEQS